MPPEWQRWSEALAALERLIDSGKLPRPRRTIRLLAMGEVYGSMHYIQQNPERIKNTVAAICLDTPAGFYIFAGTEYTLLSEPSRLPNPTWMRSSWSLRRRISQAQASFSRGALMMGTDTFLSDPAIGVPTVWPYSSSGVHTHHNSEDTPDDVDPRSLKIWPSPRRRSCISSGHTRMRPTPAGWPNSLFRGVTREFVCRRRSCPRRSLIERRTPRLGRLLHDGLEKLCVLGGSRGAGGGICAAACASRGCRTARPADSRVQRKPNFPITRGVRAESLRSRQNLTRSWRAPRA